MFAAYTTGPGNSWMRSSHSASGGRGGPCAPCGDAPASRSAAMQAAARPQAASRSLGDSSPIREGDRPLTTASTAVLFITLPFGHLATTYVESGSVPSEIRARKRSASKFRAATCISFGVRSGSDALSIASARAPAPAKYSLVTPLQALTLAPLASPQSTPGIVQEHPFFRPRIA